MFKKGDPRPPGAGRKKGDLNKVTVEQRLKQLNCDPIEYAARVVNNDVPCGVCRGAGVTIFQPRRKRSFDLTNPEEVADWAEGQDKKEADGKPRKCQSCWGSKLERIDPKTRLDAAVRLMSKIAPDLKAIEATIEQSGEMDHRIEIVFK